MLDCAGIVPITAAGRGATGSREIGPGSLTAARRIFGYDASATRALATPGPTCGLRPALRRGDRRPVPRDGTPITSSTRFFRDLKVSDYRRCRGLHLRDLTRQLLTHRSHAASERPLGSTAAVTGFTQVTVFLVPRPEPLAPRPCALMTYDAHAPSVHVFWIAAGTVGELLEAAK